MALEGNVNEAAQNLALGIGTAIGAIGRALASAT